MKNKIKIGEYVRTKYGFIAQVIDVTDTLYWFDKFIDDKEGITPVEYLDKNSKQIVNHSKNIIDLIEVGDYVNGNYVSEIKEYEDGKTILVLIGIVDEKDIKTILTKEQYKANCYTVERKE